MPGIRYGSVCSGIEAATAAWSPLGWTPAWFAEIEQFPCELLAQRYPGVENLGDMTKIAAKVRSGEIEAPDVLCGGTPCQAFSIAGLRKSMEDPRGQLTLAFIDLLNAIDEKRIENGKSPAICFWENVPGVLGTKDNAFGCFLAALAGADEPAVMPGDRSWPKAGVLQGPARRVAWRVLDAQHFGLAQRRKRVFAVAGAGAGFDPAAVLFEREGLPGSASPCGEVQEGSARDSEARPGADGGARGEDRDGAASVVAEVFKISSATSNGMTGRNPKVGFQRAELSKTLDMNGGDPTCLQGGDVRSAGKRSGLAEAKPERPQNRDGDNSRDGLRRACLCAGRDRRG